MQQLHLLEPSVHLTRSHHPSEPPSLETPSQASIGISPQIPPFTLCQCASSLASDFSFVCVLSSSLLQDVDH